MSESSSNIFYEPEPISELFPHPAYQPQPIPGTEILLSDLISNQYLEDEWGTKLVKWQIEFSGFRHDINFYLKQRSMPENVQTFLVIAAKQGSIVDLDLWEQLPIDPEFAETRIGQNGWAERLGGEYITWGEVIQNTKDLLLFKSISKKRKNAPDVPLNDKELRLVYEIDRDIHRDYHRPLGVPKRELEEVLAGLDFDASMPVVFNTSDKNEIADKLFETENGSLLIALHVSSFPDIDREKVVQDLIEKGYFIDDNGYPNRDDFYGLPIEFRESIIAEYYNRIK